MRLQTPLSVDLSLPQYRWKSRKIYSDGYCYLFRTYVAPDSWRNRLKPARPSRWSMLKNRMLNFRLNFHTHPTYHDYFARYETLLRLYFIAVFVPQSSAGDVIALREMPYHLQTMNRYRRLRD